jgi:MscS family membrane protein
LSPIQNNIVGIGIFFAAIVAITLTSIFYSTVLFIIQKINSFFANFFSSPKGKEIYTETVIYYKKWLILISLLIITDITLLVIPKENILKYLEYVIGLSIAIIIGWLVSRLFDKFFHAYLFESSINRKINGELFVVANIVADALIVLVVLVIFAQTHHINLLALTASLGIGGIAIAFAFNQTLSQLLGGIVLYIDRPFVVDDYVGLPDGTFGKIESIGLRTTKIRNSGKGTVSIIPNNSLTGMAIENFTGARKVLTLVYLNFNREVSEHEKVLIRQEILNSTKDIFGIDSRNTEVSFSVFTSGDGNVLTQAQVNFFILGSGEIGMEMRGQLLSMAKDDIIFQLQQYGIDFEIEERTINVDAPITL